MTPQADRVIGRLIADRYRVVARVGSGGMGEVYRAEHVGLKRPTALKFMRPALGQDADALARFRREAEQASRISHPNVAAIYDFGDTGDGHVFLAMEFIEGESLADRIAREGRLPPADAAQIILGAAAGLGAAHRRGILHRDLKPANIMIGEHGQVLVLDWGGGTTDGYRAPEHDSDHVDGRTDVFALGAILRDLVRVPGARTARPLASIVARATEPDPARRYATPAALGADVRHFVDGAAVSAHRESPLEWTARQVRIYRTPIALILAYLAMRGLLLFWSR
jgi:serine/threonine protein kinase